MDTKYNFQKFQKAVKTRDVKSMMLKDNCTTSDHKERQKSTFKTKWYIHRCKTQIPYL